MKLLPLLTFGTLVLSTSVMAQRVKTVDQFYTGSASGAIRNAFNSPARQLYLGIQTEYHWRFAERFSIGANVGFGFADQNYYNKQYAISIAPEFRYWVPMKNSRIQPFMYVNYGMKGQYGENTTTMQHYWGGAAGIGAIGWLNDSWGIQGKYDIMRITSNGAGFNTNNSRMQIGVVYRPGQKKKANTEK